MYHYMLCICMYTIVSDLYVQAMQSYPLLSLNCSFPLFSFDFYIQQHLEEADDKPIIFVFDLIYFSKAVQYHYHQGHHTGHQGYKHYMDNSGH